MSLNSRTEWIEVVREEWEQAFIQLEIFEEEKESGNVGSPIFCQIGATLGQSLKIWRGVSEAPLHKVQESSGMIFLFINKDFVLNLLWQANHTK